MALNPTTPGVYVNEVSTLPPSVAGVPTSIPVFIGYTEKAVIDGVAWTFTNPTPPVRLTSMLDYNAVFGGPFLESGYTMQVNADGSVTAGGTASKFDLYYQLLMYFANGGGPFYVISMGVYSANPSGPSTTLGDWTNAINEAEKADEVSIVVIPEAMRVGDSLRASIYDAMLAHCAKMQDRFAIFDVENDTTIANAAQNFRSSNVGINNLKYGAAYYPQLNTLLSRSFDESAIALTDMRPGSFFAGPNNTLSALKNGTYAYLRIQISGTYDASDSLVFKDASNATIATITLDATSDTVSELAGKINANTTLAALLVATASGSEVVLRMKVLGAAGNGQVKLSESNTTTANMVFLPAGFSGVLSGGGGPDTSTYNKAVDALNEYGALSLYPSATMAGIYAAVDNDRGVWKAPANVSVNGIESLSVNISAQDQQGLNVDPTSGKSINAIRFFNGKGNLVWGARTLAGNDNEWRYVNVRRLFIYVEESTRKATAQFVFEGNDKNSWQRIKGMINNFLTDLWRQGALAGSKPEQAFFVNVGLGETMTAQDVLEGKLIVRIGMAAVRPAEFIILEFQHKLQES